MANKNEYTADDLKHDVQSTADEARDVARRAADRAGDAIDDLTGNTTADRARAKGEELAGKVQDMADAARQKASAAAETARDLGREYAGIARDEADRLYRDGERRLKEAGHAAEGYYDEVSGMVRRNPAQALGIAAGLGFLVGLILARR